MTHPSRPRGRSWARSTSALELGWLEVRCGSMVPDSDELAQ